MTASKPSVFVRTALQSGLVTRHQIDEAIAQVRATGGLDALPAVGIGDDRLADALVEMGLLTPYQCQQLRAGRKKLSLGPYLITDWLGQGGMGQVFVAVHQMMERTVAIKVLPLSKSTPDAIASFTREIQTQAKLDHRHLVRAYDAGRDGNVYFLVTEYVPGTDLRRLVRNQGRLTMAQGASVISQAAIGLGYAHEQGLVHRDVKPGNLLVTPDGLVKVSDLGLAGFLHEGEDDPRAGKIVGTADYLAPEKITSPQTASSVSDIYSLGCTLYYAVTGKVPFPGGSTREKARRHCEETPWHPRQFNADVTDDFVDLIADMMEKQPQRRVQTAAEVVDRLAPWVAENEMLPRLQPAIKRWHAPPVPTTNQPVETVDETIGEAVDLGNNDSTSESQTARVTPSQGASPKTPARSLDPTSPHNGPDPRGPDPRGPDPRTSDPHGSDPLADRGQTDSSSQSWPSGQTMAESRGHLSAPLAASSAEPARQRPPRWNGQSEQRGRSQADPHEVRQAVILAICWTIPLAMLAGGLLSYFLFAA